MLTYINQLIIANIGLSATYSDMVNPTMLTMSDKLKVDLHQSADYRPGPSASN